MIHRAGQVTALASALAVALLPVSAWADPSFECATASPSQVETGDCLAQAEASVTAALDAALNMARAWAGDLDGATGRPLALPALEAGQAAWSAYRDAHCGHVGALFGGGSGTGIAIGSCRVALGRARVDTLLSLSR